MRNHTLADVPESGANLEPQPTSTTTGQSNSLALSPSLSSELSDEELSPADTTAIVSRLQRALSASALPRLISSRGVAMRGSKTFSADSSPKLSPIVHAISDPKLKFDQLRRSVRTDIQSEYPNLTDTVVEEINGMSDHMLKENIEVISFMPHEQDKLKSNPTVVIHYGLGFVSAIDRAQAFAAEKGYYPEHIAHIKSLETVHSACEPTLKERQKVTFLNESEKPLNLQDATIYFSICYASKKHLSGTQLDAALRCYHGYGATDLIIYLGTDDGIEANRNQKMVWINKNKSIVDEAVKNGINVRIVDREDWVKQPAYIRAEKFCASEVVDTSSFKNSHRNDIIERMQQKGFIPRPKPNNTKLKNAKQSEAATQAISVESDIKPKNAAVSNNTTQLIPASVNDKATAGCLPPTLQLDPVAMFFLRIDKASDIAEQAKWVMLLANYSAYVQQFTSASGQVVKMPSLQTTTVFASLFKSNSGRVSPTSCGQQAMLLAQPEPHSALPGSPKKT